MVPGATFAKAWCPKQAASILTKLYHRRGQTSQGWLTDALQGRITCDTRETVDGVVEFFNDVLSKQRQAAMQNNRTVLSTPPTVAEIMSYDISGLQEEECKKPVDELATFCRDVMTSEGVLIISFQLLCCLKSAAFVCHKKSSVCPVCASASVLYSALISLTCRSSSRHRTVGVRFIIICSNLFFVTPWSHTN
jgi:hypothetical protein